MTRLPRLMAGAALMLAAGSWAGPPSVHRLARDNPPQREMAAVVTAEAAAPAWLAERLATARPAEFPAGARLMLLSTGPLLDQPDHAAAQAWQRDGARLNITVEHSRARAHGQVLERNLGWRPLLQAALPDDLPPGDYTLTVRWHGTGAEPRFDHVQTLNLRLRARTP